MRYKWLTCSGNSIFLWRHAYHSLINVFRTRMCGQTLLFIVIANCAIRCKYASCCSRQWNQGEYVSRRVLLTDRCLPVRRHFTHLYVSQLIYTTNVQNDERCSTNLYTDCVGIKQTVRRTIQRETFIADDHNVINTRNRRFVYCI